MTVPATPDPFAMLGLEPRFDLDTAALEARFRERSREVHPDRFAAAPAAERAQAVIRARALNDAYQVLRKPERRAEHLLARAGITIGDNEPLDVATLSDLLELREELADARAAGRLAQVRELEAEMKARREHLLRDLPGLFTAQTPDALARAKRNIILLRYVARYLAECDAALDDEV